MLRTNAPLGVFYRAAGEGVADVHPGLGIDFAVLTAQIKESLMRDRKPGDDGLAIQWARAVTGFPPNHDKTMTMESVDQCT